ncbi:43139_t:CDS:2, partial [Gigaspora margarita]
EVEDSSVSEEEEKNTATNSSNTPSLTKNKKARQFSEIWDYFIKGIEKSYGHYKQKENQIIFVKKKNSTPVSQTSITSHFSSNHLLPKATINQLDQKITKAWIMAGVPFDVIENLFIIDMFKEFLLAYNPLLRITLSG